jgi:hypothetical protein
LFERERKTWTWSSFPMLAIACPAAPALAQGLDVGLATGSDAAWMDRTFEGSEHWRMLSRGHLDQSPTSAPNAILVLCAAREDHRSALYAVSADGRVRQRLVLADGDVREPAWSPCRQR